MMGESVLRGLRVWLQTLLLAVLWLLLLLLLLLLLVLSLLRLQ